MGTTLKDKLAALPAKRRRKIEARAYELIAEELSLQELRKARDKTQHEMAATLNMTQSEISRLESRSDLLLSTMQRFVKGLGGSLELVARFPDSEPVMLTGFGELSADTPAMGEKRTARPRRRSAGAIGRAAKASREKRERA